VSSPGSWRNVSAGRRSPFRPSPPQVRNRASTRLLVGLGCRTAAADRWCRRLRRLRPLRLPLRQPRPGSRQPTRDWPRSQPPLHRRRWPASPLSPARPGSVADASSTGAGWNSAFSAHDPCGCIDAPRPLPPRPSARRRARCSYIPSWSSRRCCRHGDRPTTARQPLAPISLRRRPFLYSSAMILGLQPEMGRRRFDIGSGHARIIRNAGTHGGALKAVFVARS
jgi:hypothetical protein